MAKNSANDYTIAAVVRALKILKLFDADTKTMTLSEISEKSGIAKSSVLRVLASLEQEQFVNYDEETRKYKLGIAIYKLSSTAFDFVDVKEVAQPFLKDFAKKHHLHMHLAVLQNEEPIVIERVYPFDTKEVLLLQSEVGGPTPIHATGVGKVLTAFAPKDVQDRMINKCDFFEYSKSTITDPVEYREVITQVKKQGYAENNGENEPYITCVTYPIYNVKNEVVAALSATGHYKYMTPEVVKETKIALKETTTEISRLQGADL